MLPIDLAALFDGRYRPRVPENNRSLVCIYGPRPAASPATGEPWAAYLRREAARLRAAGRLVELRTTRDGVSLWANEPR